MTSSPQRETPERGFDPASCRVLVSGSSGLVGSALVDRLASEGHPVSHIVRAKAGQARAGQAGEVLWDTDAGSLDARAIAADAVVHLAGESIAEGRWTPAKMERIRSSRVEGTDLLARTLSELDHKPEVLVCASAIGFYGDRGSEEVDESSALGTGFLAEVCEAWEDATRPARDAGIRVVNIRLGVVLSADGGALAKMLLPFKLGVGGKIGSGEQYMSWIALDDVVGAIRHAIRTPELSGPVNLTAPAPVTNLEFTKTLGRVLSRPTIAPMPAFAARLAFGKMADELLLGSTRVAPRALEKAGYRFRHPELEGALRAVLGKA